MAEFYPAILVAALVATAAGVWLYSRRRPRPVDPTNDYPRRRDWTRSTRSLNYSSFVYLDVDRDGHYGIFDRPMAGVVVRLSGDAGHLKTATTNVNGFANFRTSMRSRRAPISRPGTYRFSVSVPPGFISTSGNEVQSKAFRPISGSPSGIGSEEMVKPVGLAPVRQISGHVAPGVTATLAIMRGKEVIAEETLRPGQPFRLVAPENAEAVAVSGTGHDRFLMLSPYPTCLGLLSTERTAMDAGAPLETIDFDDVTSGGLKKIPSGYRGLNWFNLNALSRDFQAGSEGYINGNTSGHHLCYMSTGHPAEIWSDRPFGFHSVMLCGAWLCAEGEIATIESWRGQTLVARDQIVLSALTPLHYAPMLEGITRIRLSSEHYWQIAIDDLRLAR